MLFRSICGQLGGLEITCRGDMDVVGLSARSDGFPSRHASRRHGESGLRLGGDDGGHSSRGGSSVSLLHLLVLFELAAHPVSVDGLDLGHTVGLGDGVGGLCRGPLGASRGRGRGRGHGGGGVPWILGGVGVRCGSGGVYGSGARHERCGQLIQVGVQHGRREG